MPGIHAAVIGLLLAALYQPVITSAVFTPIDAVFACTAFVLLHGAKCPPWLLVALGALLGQLSA